MNAKLHSSPADESSDDESSGHQSHHQQQQQQQQRGKIVDAETVLTSKPFGMLRPLADRHHAVLLRVATATLHTTAIVSVDRHHAVLLRVATATLHTTAIVNADDCDDDGRSDAAVETILLVEDKQSVTMPSVTDDDVVAIVENSPSDEWAASAATASDTGCQSASPSPRRARPSTSVPTIETTQAQADDEVFRAVSGATLTVDSCLADGRPSLSSTTDGQTDWTRLSGSDESPLPDTRPSASITLVPDPAAQARLTVPSPPPLPQPRDRMPTRRCRRSARAGINIRSLAAPRLKSGSSNKRSTRRERKVTKTLAIVLGKIIFYNY